MENFANETLWERPGGVASVGFHLQHLAGVLDRLFTYARGEALSEAQAHYLAAEGKPDSRIHASDLIAAFDKQVARAIERLRGMNETTLTEYRAVGRAQLPS